MREENISFLMKDVALFLVVSQSVFVYKTGRGRGAGNHCSISGTRLFCLFYSMVWISHITEIFIERKTYNCISDIIPRNNSFSIQTHHFNYNILLCIDSLTHYSSYPIYSKLTNSFKN